MKIKMLTTKCGPISSENWVEGQKRNVSVEEARYWEKIGVCSVLEPYPAPETAVVKPVEKAVVKPAETATAHKTATQVSTPATTTGVASTKPAAWGTPEVK